MNNKTLTLGVAFALVAISAMPIAAAHWRGSYDTPAGSVTTTNVNWDAPHEHVALLPGGWTGTAYSPEAQRLCLGKDGSIYWSKVSDGSCQFNNAGPVPQQHLPPVRGFSGTLATSGCNDVDAIGHPNFIKNQPRAGIAAAELDWGFGTTGPAGLNGVYSFAFADYFAHAVRSGPAPAAGWPADGFTPRQGTHDNPTGATPSFFPKITVVSNPSAQQADVVQRGLGYLGTGTGSKVSATNLPPGVDYGDNDFEFCTGLGSHTFAIDSGVARRGYLTTGTTTATTVTAIDGASYGYNDIRGIGGDCVYDVVICSPVIDTGDLMPKTSIVPVGVLLSVTTTGIDPDAHDAVQYLVCRGHVGFCTNVPPGGVGSTNAPNAARLGNAPGDVAPYASLQACSWDPAQTPRLHSGSGREYRGQASIWISNRGNGNTCWPERLVRIDDAPTALWFPSTQATSFNGGTWAPEHLSASYNPLETISFTIDSGGTRPLHQFDSGCAQNQAFNPTAPFCGPGGNPANVAPPDQWVEAWSSVTAFNAVFQQI